MIMVQLYSYLKILSAYTYMRMYVCMFVYMYIYIYIYVYIYIFACTCTYSCICICMCICIFTNEHDKIVLYFILTVLRCNFNLQKSLFIVLYWYDLKKCYNWTPSMHIYIYIYIYMCMCMFLYCIMFDKSIENGTNWIL